MTGQTPARTWRVLEVDGAQVEVMEAGRGEPILFLHGWGLTPRAYAESVTRLCGDGFRVVAPALPGFGRSSPMPVRAGLHDFALRIGRLVDALDLGVPPFVVGHSFGGGVALRLATDRPDLVRSLTLVSAVGGAPGPSTGSGMTAGSWLRWAAGAVTELDPREWLRLGPPVLRDLVPNVLRNPLPLLGTGVVAVSAHLAAEAAALVEAGVPVLFVWGRGDRLITPGVLATVATTIHPHVVEGRHGWMITNPEEFAGILREALRVHAGLERTRRGLPAAAPGDRPVGETFPPERRRRARRPGAADARPRSGDSAPAGRRRERS